MAPSVDRSPAQTGLGRLAPDRPARVPAPIEPPAPGVLSASTDTEHFVLRPLCEQDRDSFISVVRESREHLERFSPLHLPEESDEALFERQLRLTERGETSQLACRRVAVGDNGRIHGAFNLNSIARGLVWSADLNWWVGVESAGRGIATEALRRLVRFAVADLPEGLGLHEVRAYIQRDNAISRMLATRIGFERCGEERSYIQTGDTWMVHDVWSLRVK
jgi:ribosomal-protein-alanine N-acetyltransferase